MKKTIDTKVKREKAILVSVFDKQTKEEVIDKHMDELAFLAETAMIDTVQFFKQKLDEPDIRTLVGKGKLEEIKDYSIEHDISVIIFDDDLSPSQLRNLERELQLKIYDRSLLILDIFLERAQTAQAKTQVELARNQYLLPRLTRMWTHLERQRGGTGTRGGAGEKEIETDRRMLRDKISLLKGKLDKIEKQNTVQRKSRGSIVRVALVGYTNAGKSTIMTMLSKSDVKAEDKLFATVDATVRKVVYHAVPFLLSDTVGFIRKLPHHLIESFKSTLAEVQEADILLHVVDASHVAHDDQINVVNETLKDIEADSKPTLYIFNKIDQLKADKENPNPIQSLRQRHRHFEGKDSDLIMISAKNKTNIDELREKIFGLVRKKHITIFPNYLENERYY